MKAFRLLTVVMMLAMVGACKDDDDPEEPKITISGFTERDDNGNLSGSVDPADWNLNTEFNSLENKLFPATSLSLCTDFNDSILNVSVYPNPNDGVFVFRTIVQHDFIQVRIVDEQLNVLYSNDSISGAGTTITEDKDAGQRAVRLYYRVYNGNCVYQGYGDVSIR